MAIFIFKFHSTCIYAAAAGILETGQEVVWLTPGSTPVPAAERPVYVCVFDKDKRVLLTQKSFMRSWYPGEASLSGHDGTVVAVVEVEGAPVDNHPDTQLVTFQISPKGVKSRKCNRWGLPGGKANAEEDVVTAGLRELREETGFDRSDIRIANIGIVRGYEGAAHEATESGRVPDYWGLLLNVTPEILDELFGTLNRRLAQSKALKEGQAGAPPLLRGLYDAASSFEDGTHGTAHFRRGPADSRIRDRYPHYLHFHGVVPASGSRGAASASSATASSGEVIYPEAAPRITWDTFLGITGTSEAPSHLPVAEDELAACRLVTASGAWSVTGGALTYPKTEFEDWPMEIVAQALGLRGAIASEAMSWRTAGPRSRQGVRGDTSRKTGWGPSRHRPTETEMARPWR